MKKKLIALLLALTMALSLTACGGRTENGSASDGSTSVGDTSGVSSEAVPADAAQLPDGSEVPDGETDGESEAEQPAELPVETQKPAGQPDQKPAEKPAEKPASSSGSTGSSSASGGNSSAAAPATDPAPEAGKAVDLSAFYASVSSGGNWPAMMALEGETLDALYPGLSAIQTNQCGAYTAMISAAVGEIALVEVANSADVQAVKDIFQARVDYQVGDDTNPGGAWYPASIEGWKSGSRIVSNGNYVMLVALSEGADSVVDSFNALFA